MRRSIDTSFLAFFRLITLSTSIALVSGHIALEVFAQSSQTVAKRSMTFMDIVEMRSVGSPAISPNGQWLLHTLTTPDWQSGKSSSDIYLVSISRGIAPSRQMTFTKDKNESSPAWSSDGAFFVFSSNREAPESRSSQNQIYMMRPDGGEAQKISDAKDGVGSFAFSKDGKWFAYSAGKEDERQIWIISTAELGKGKPAELTKRKAPITWWQFSPDGKLIYFLSPDSVESANKMRKEKKFDVKVRNEDSPLLHLYSLDLNSKKESRLTTSPDYTVSDVRISKDGKWVGFRGGSANRHKRTITEANTYSDLYLLEVATENIERLTSNEEIGESSLSFSPDGTMIAFSASDDFTYFRNSRVYVRPTAARGGVRKKLGTGFDADVTIGFWSDDGKTIYFNEGLGATNQFCSVSLESGVVSTLTNFKGSLNVTQDEETKTLLLTYSDPTSPQNIYVARSVKTIPNRSSWIQLTNSNPQVAGLALGETEAIQWKSTDGKMVEGVLVKPVGYERGKRYPLIVQIHGGPAAASMLNFNAGHGNYSHVFTGAGYVCLLPNYRGSSNYGEQFKMQISGDYFRQGYEDIITGVDHLIALGIVDGEKMGAMGWSAGGHWSNWILTHSDRFKAISSGAGAVNWISMYAQSDIQRNREFYYGGKPYDNIEHYWQVSPLKYIKNAKTPTLIHVVDGDPRVPRPQSEELYMALVKLGVPTELYVYPGTTHGIPDMRNQMVKMVAEFNWFEKWIRGKQSWFDWKELLDTLKEEKKEEKKETTDSP